METKNTKATELYRIQGAELAERYGVGRLNSFTGMTGNAVNVNPYIACENAQGRAIFEADRRPNANVFELTMVPEPGGNNPTRGALFSFYDVDRDLIEVSISAGGGAVYIDQYDPENNQATRLATTANYTQFDQIVLTFSVPYREEEPAYGPFRITQDHGNYLLFESHVGFGFPITDLIVLGSRTDLGLKVSNVGSRILSFAAYSDPSITE